MGGQSVRDTNRMKKIYRIIGICFVGVALITGAVIYTMSGKSTVAEALELGNHYLSDLDYDAAIREYSYVLELDPLNEEALAGLAASYAGMGNMDMAEKIFEEKLSDSENVEVWRSYAKILEDNGKYKRAVRLISKIVEKEDTEESYQWLKTVLEKIIVKQYLYAESSSVIISQKNDTVYTMGSNILGALGTAEGIGTEVWTESLEKADFSEAPKSVFTTGTNSYVIDANQDLWIAGSNRSSQQANNKVQLLPVAGWTKETELTGIAKVAGTDSTVFALTKDGSLWMRGANSGYITGNAWKETWTLIQEYGTIIDIQCIENRVAILTMAGEVYITEADSSYLNQFYVARSSWRLVAENVIDFMMNKRGAYVYLTTDGRIDSSYNNVLPRDWKQYDMYGYFNGYQPSLEIEEVALIGEGIYLLDDSGELYFVADGECVRVKEAGSLIHIYASGESCIGQKDNGYVVLDSSGNVKK